MDSDEDEFESNFHGMSDLEDDEDSDEEDNVQESHSNSWKDVHPRNVSFRINSGRKAAFKKAVRDINQLKKKIKEMSNKSDPEPDDVADLFFGENSQFATTLSKIISLTCSKELLYKFLQTYVVQNIITKDTTNFYLIVEDTLGIKTPNEKIPLGKKEYEDIWKKLAEFGKNRADAPASRRPKPGWEEIQEALNGLFRAIIIEGREDIICIVIDDDKIWLDNTGENSEDRFKLKIVRHVNDNRNGMNAHTTVTGGFLVPANAHMEIEGASSMICFEQSMSDLFQGNIRSQNSYHNTEVYTDRGYTDKKRVDKTLRSGGDVLGTVKRNTDWGFTYDQKLKPGDKRKMLTTKGCASLFVKKQKINEKTLTLSAFKNGTDSIALAISSMHRGHSWEGIPFTDGYITPRTLDFITTAYINKDDLESSEEDAKRVVLDYMHINVDFLTIRQGTSDWFLLRKWSFSSSQAWATFSVSFKFLHRNNSGVKDKCQRVAKTMHGPTWENAFLEMYEQIGADIIDVSKEDVSFHEHIKALINEPFSPDVEPWKQFLYDIYHNYITCDKVLCKEEAEKLVQERLADDNHLKSVHDALRKRVTSIESELSKPKMIKDIQDLLLSNNSTRKYLFYAKEILLCTCSKYRLKVKRINKEGTLIKRLLEFEADTSRSNSLPRDINVESTGKKEIKRKLMQQSFQSNFKGARKAACVVGHKNEPKVIQNFAKDANNGKLSNIAGIQKVVAVFTTGLVGKKGLPYIKDSIDALAVVQTTDEDNDELEIWGVEIKTRVSTKEYNKEKEFQSDLLDITDLDEKLYTTIKDNEIHSSMKKLSERTQILHHSYVYNLTKILFLVGDVNGNIIHGNAIELSEGLLHDYGECLKAMYGDALSWAYQETVSENELKKVSAIAETIPTIGGSEEFLSQFYLWRHVSRTQNLPMPPLKRIIPAIHANWNAFKSGSDTTTAIMESHRFKHPHINCNSRASSRLLMLAFVFIHRSLQAITCNPDNHKSLKNLRKAASDRYSFNKTLNFLNKYFQHKAKKERLAKAREIANLPLVPPPEPSRTSHRLGGPVLKYTTPRTFETPTRNYRTDFNRKPDDSEYWKRVTACQYGKAGGLPFFAQFCEPGREQTKPYRCWLCSKDTFAMCYTCRRPLCNVRKVIKNRQFPKDTVRVKPFTNLDQRKDDAMWYGVKTCFFKEHSYHVKEINYQADEGEDEQDLSGSE